MKRIFSILIICIISISSNAEVYKKNFVPQCAKNHDASNSLSKEYLQTLMDSIKNLFYYDSTLSTSYIYKSEIKPNYSTDNYRHAEMWYRAISNGDYIWDRIVVKRIADNNSSFTAKKSDFLEYLFNPRLYEIEIHPEPSVEEIYATLNFIKSNYIYEVPKKEKHPKIYSSSYIHPIDENKPDWRSFIDNPQYLCSRLSVKDIISNSIISNIDDYRLLEYLFDTNRYVISVSTIKMTKEEIENELAKLNKLYSCQMPFSANCIRPKYKCDSAETEYLRWMKHTKYADILWNRTYIQKFEDKSKLLEILFNPEYGVVNITPNANVTYIYNRHQSGVGFSANDGCFYVKRTTDGKTYLMVSHQDTRTREAKIARHGNCTYDQQFESMTIKFKDGTTKTITNYSPIHNIDCDEYHCHKFTEQFNITGIKFSNIEKIRFSSLYDKFDYENEYLGEMMSLMEKAAKENLKESIEMDKF